MKKVKKTTGELTVHFDDTSPAQGAVVGPLWLVVVTLGACPAPARGRGGFAGEGRGPRVAEHGPGMGGQGERGKKVEHEAMQPPPQGVPPPPPQHHKGGGVGAVQHNHPRQGGTNQPTGVRVQPPLVAVPCPTPTLARAELSRQGAGQVPCQGIHQAQKGGRAGSAVATRSRYHATRAACTTRSTGM